jgi:hypothetical protein
VAGRPQAKGECAYCGAVAAKGAMTKHLAACPRRVEAIGAAERGGGARETLLHLRVEDQYDKAFFLDLEMRASAPLKKLDDYLRAIWLECCGHLSQFSPGGWGSEKIAMRRAAGEVFRPGTVITHIYDFGTSSVTLVRLSGSREGAPVTKHPITLLARNLMPDAACMECDEPATRLCLECLYEHDAPGKLCDAHAKTHGHDNYGEPLALVNSPRMGLCGYEGPADPPY